MRSIRSAEPTQPLCYGLLDFGLILLRYSNGEMTAFRLQDAPVAQSVFMQEFARWQSEMISLSSPMSQTA